MLTTVSIKILDIYVPSDRRKEIDPVKANDFAGQLINGEELKPIKVRKGKGRYVLVSGVNRLNAHDAIGESFVEAFIVRARQF